MKRILVIEDSPTQAEDLRMILEAKGFEVGVAHDGTRGLAMVEAHGWELVLSDIVMPGMSGYDVCRAIKAAAPGLPVVLVTSLGDPMDVIRSLEAGADGFVLKPYEAGQLVARVRSTLENHALRQRGSDGATATMVFQGQRFTIGAGRRQVLHMLVSTFEDIVRKNRELQARQAELLRVQQQKDELSALLVHDLKSPLNGVFLLVRALLRSPRLDQEERESLEMIRASCDAIQRMVMNLLDISRREDGQLVPRLARVDTAALLAEIAREMGVQAGQQQQTIDVVIGEGDLHASCDRDMMRRVLENLVDNGLRFTPRGAALTLEAIDRGEGVELRVSDLGPGVPDGYRERIFDKYVQVAGATGGGRAGRGLGLVFCRMAAEAHGGRIWVQPNEPRGATFCVRLPRTPPATT